MSIPKNPETIIVKNKYYPDGLKEIDIWNYYQKNKNLILRETLGRELIVFFATDVNKTIVIRKVRDKLIYLNPSNYDNIISGRTLSIHSTMHRENSFGIIDIDVDDIDVAKEAVIDVVPVIEKAPFVEDVKIRFTGKSSFHIVCYFRRPLIIDKVKILIKNFLEDSTLSNNYDIEYKRRKGITNLDLAPNKYRGGYITLGSLSTIGLRCVEVPLRSINRFRKESSEI